MQPEDDDLEAFREATKDVAPLKHDAKVVQSVPVPEPVPLQSKSDDAAVLRDSLRDPLDGELTLEIGEELSYRRDGIATNVLRRLRRGEWSIQDHLDLHGLTVEQARALLATFVNQAVKRGIRCIRVVHGKGHRSAQGEPVLKRKVGHWLMQRDEVLAYVQAKPEDGGGGALIVLLRGTRPQSVHHEEEF